MKSSVKILLLLMLPVLAACSNSTVRSTLGLTRTPPDEFRVVERPPLSVPPDFNLRPPAPVGTPPRNMPPSSEQAQKLVMGTGNSGTAITPGTAETAVQPVTSEALESPADAQFLHDAGAAGADDDIRTTLGKEQAANAPENQSYLDKLGTPPDKQPVVNAPAEAARLQADKASGKPVTAGDTPMVQPKDTGPLGRLLGY